jgi:diguanylate cyclase (GGDEF)-like protein
MHKDFRQKTLVTAPVASLSAPQNELCGTLTVLIGADVGAAFTLGTTTTLIGRNPNAQVTIADDGVSRDHARIWADGARYELEDLGSTNGTFLDGRRVQGRMPLHDGARIHLGHTLMRFALQDRIERESSRRIYEMSVRDGLTGVYNRRYFDERLITEFAFAVRHRTQLCVLLADIDHFKRINDQIGHQAGDQVLRAIADELRKGIRTEDVVARYGGEEFAMIARGIDPNGALLFAERVRSLVERANVTWEGRRVPVTISVGVAHTHVAPPAARGEELTAAADAALYRAKRAGRNRVESTLAHDQDSTIETASRGRSRRYWEQSTHPLDE